MRIIPGFILIMLLALSSSAQHIIRYGDTTYMKYDEFLHGFIIKSRLPDGYWKVYNNNRVVEECVISDSERNGPDIFYDTNGHKIEESNYVNDTLDGYSITYNTDLVISMQYYFDGREKTNENFDSNGALVFRETQWDGYMIKREYYKNGNKKSECVIIDDSQKQRALPSKYSLNIIGRGYEVPDDSIAWERLDSLHLYPEDSANGDTLMDESGDGKVYLCVVFNNLSYAWYENGSIKEKIGETDSLGTEKYFYYQNGVMEKKGRYLNNRRNGPWYYYDSKGKLYKTEVYKAGVLVK